VLSNNNNNNNKVDNTKTNVNCIGLYIRGNSSLKI